MASFFSCCFSEFLRPYEFFKDVYSVAQSPKEECRYAVHVDEASAEVIQQPPKERIPPITRIRIAKLITDILQHKSVVRRYEKFELTFRLTEPYDNPYDSRDVEAWAVFFGPEPTQTETLAPGFYDQKFTVVESEGCEKLVKAGDPHWKILFAPNEVGLHHFEIKVRYRQGPIFTSATESFECIAGESSGFVRRVANSPFLRFDDDSPSLPIGHNLAWDDKSDKKFRPQELRENYLIPNYKTSANLFPEK